MSKEEIVYFLLGLVPTLIVVLNYLGNKKKDTQSDTAAFTTVNVKLDSISRNIEDLKADIKGINARVETLSKVQTEHSVKIEMLQKEINQYYKEG